MRGWSTSAGGMVVLSFGGKVIGDEAAKLGADRRAALSDEALERGGDLRRKGDGEGDLAVWADCLCHVSSQAQPAPPSLNRAGMWRSDTKVCTDSKIGSFVGVLDEDEPRLRKPRPRRGPLWTPSQLRYVDAQVSRRTLDVLNRPRPGRMPNCSALLPEGCQPP